MPGKRDWLYEYELKWSRQSRVDKKLTKEAKIRMKKEREKYSVRFPDDEVVLPVVKSQSVAAVMIKPDAEGVATKHVVIDEASVAQTSSEKGLVICGDFAPIREIAQSNVAKVDHILTTAEKVRYREHCVGSKGGHIARELKAPGPLNGHRFIRPEDKFFSIDEALSCAKPLNQEHHTLLLPEWNSR